MTITVFEIPPTDGNDFSSYVSVEEANVYYSLDPDHGWNQITKADPDDPSQQIEDVQRKEVLLINATRRIDLLHFISAKSEPDQELKWPRINYGLPYDIELATILLANILRTDPAQQFVTSANARLKLVKAGSVEIEYYEPATLDIDNIELEQTISDPTIRAILAPYLSTGVPVSSADIADYGAAYGTDSESMFTELYRYRRNVVY